MKRSHLVFLILSFAVIYSTAYPQNAAGKSSELVNWIETEFRDAIDSLNIAGATILLMNGDSIVHMKGYGLADMENNIPFSDSATLFGLASVSKTFVGVAVMKLFEDGKLNLDEDINNYLKSLKVDYKYDIPITIRHLLTHTAGLDERNLGNRVRTEQEIISLAEYLKKRLPPQIRPPGEVLTYSNHGYALLGLIVEDLSGLPFHEFVKRNILQPLDMNFSSFKSQAVLRKNYSVSYLQKADTLIPYKPSFILQYPAGSMSSTTKEMSHYISMLLNYGKYGENRILDSLTVSKMFSPAFKHYKEAQNGWLWGFYENQWNGLRVVQHAGDLDGFANTLLLIPEENIGLFISINSSSLTNSKSREFIRDFANQLFHKILPVYAQVETDPGPPDAGFVKKELKSFQGVYRQTRYARTTLDKVAVFIGLSPEIRILLKNDTLEIQDRNEQLLPVSDLVFYGTTEKKYVAFGENYKGDIAYFYSDNVSYHKLKWFETVKFQLYLIGSIVLMFLIFISGSLVRRLFLAKRKMYLIEKINLAITLLALFFLLFFGLTLLKTDPYEFTFGISAMLKALLFLPFIIIALVLFSCYLLIRAVRIKKLNFWKFNFPVSISALLFIAWLYYWNLIGFNF